MAIGRLHMKVGKTRNAAAHAQYIAREGIYASKLDASGERLEALRAGNMPAWAADEPRRFWEASDAYERSNGTCYREMEIALPRELTPQQRIELVEEWVSQEIGDKHAYQWAIHVPKAADGGDQPHVHLMFSERRQDGISRDPETYFKRYNSKNPERGGCRKGYGEQAGQKLSRGERAAELKRTRERWADICNKHLELAGREERIDMRSYKDQGVKKSPERKQLPSQWRSGKGKEAVLTFREAREAAKAERAKAAGELREDLEAIAGQRRASGAFERMPLNKLREWVATNRPASLDERVSQDPHVREAVGRHISADQSARALEAELASLNRRGAAPDELRELEGRIAAQRQMAEAALDARKEAVARAKADHAPAAKSDEMRHARASAVLEHRDRTHADVEAVIREVSKLARQSREGGKVEVPGKLRHEVERMIAAQGRGRGGEKELRAKLRLELNAAPAKAAELSAVVKPPSSEQERER